MLDHAERHPPKDDQAPKVRQLTGAVWYVHGEAYLGELLAGPWSQPACLTFEITLTDSDLLA